MNSGLFQNVCTLYDALSYVAFALLYSFFFGDISVYLRYVVIFLFLFDFFYYHIDNMLFRL